MGRGSEKTRVGVTVSGAGGPDGSPPAIGPVGGGVIAVASGRRLDEEVEGHEAVESLGDIRLACVYPGEDAGAEVMPM